METGVSGCHLPESEHPLRGFCGSGGDLTNRSRSGGASGRDAHGLGKRRAAPAREDSAKAAAASRSPQTETGQGGVEQLLLLPPVSLGRTGVGLLSHNASGQPVLSWVKICAVVDTRR